MQNGIRLDLIIKMKIMKQIKFKKMKRILKVFILLSTIVMLYSCGLLQKKEVEIKLIPVKIGKSYGYIDLEGKIVINPQFSEATIFRDGIALVKTQSDKPKWGYINENGQFIIDAQYNECTIFNQGLAWVVKEGCAPTAINVKGELILTLEQANSVTSFTNGLAAISILDSNIEKWGYINKEGAIVIPPQFQQCKEFYNGKCAVRNFDGKWGYIDKDGKLVINYQFDEAATFFNNKAIVTLNGKVGVIDENGKYEINPQFSLIFKDNDFYLVAQNNKFGWCDKDSKFVINPQFDDAGPFFYNSLAPIKLNEMWGYCDKSGKICINPQFQRAFLFNGKLAIVESNDKFGLIDNSGKYVINPQFDGFSKDYSNELIWGGSELSVVKSEFFNIKPILDRINLLNPEGLTINDNIIKIISKLKSKKQAMSQALYNDYSYKVFSSQKLSNDAYLSFSLNGNFYSFIQQGYYKTKVLNPNALVTNLIYEINLFNNGAGKGKQVKEAIEKRLVENGYNRNDTFSSESSSFYDLKGQTVKVLAENNNIIITMQKAYTGVQETPE